MILVHNMIAFGLHIVAEQLRIAAVIIIAFKANSIADRILTTIVIVQYVHEVGIFFF